MTKEKLRRKSTRASRSLLDSLDFYRRNVRDPQSRLNFFHFFPNFAPKIPEKNFEGLVVAPKKMVRGLPPLPTRLTLKAKERKGTQLLEILRGIAIANQHEGPQVFYPIREIARHFTVPLSTVSRVYDG